MLIVIPIVFIIYGFAIFHRIGVDLPSSIAAAAYRFDAFSIFAALLASALVTAMSFSKLRLLMQRILCLLRQTSDEIKNH
jgi:hypothetical protein